jgi:hypothetical protein
MANTTYRIYVNGAKGGYILRPRGEWYRPEAEAMLFTSFAAAEAEITARGFVPSTSVDRDAEGNYLPYGKRTAYVIEGK